MNILFGRISLGRRRFVIITVFGNVIVGEGCVCYHLMVQDLTVTSLEMAQLAYLSACSTAANASHDLLNEVIHIVSAFLLVGFPHVVGTFWEAYNAVYKKWITLRTN